MESSFAAFFSNLWPVIWPILLIAAAWIVIRFVFKLAMRVMVSGCFIILLLGAAIIVLRGLR
jgi:hypothetical protein